MPRYLPNTGTAPKFARVTGAPIEPRLVFCSHLFALHVVHEFKPRFMFYSFMTLCVVRSLSANRKKKKALPIASALSHARRFGPWASRGRLALLRRLCFRSPTVRSHFGSSATPSLSGQRGACEPAAKDSIKRLPAATPPHFLRPTVHFSLPICAIRTKCIDYQLCTKVPIVRF